MKLTITASALAEALDVAEAAAIRSKSTQFPALAGVLLDAREYDDLLTVSGTDTRVRAWRDARAEVAEAGAVVAPVKALASFLGAVPGDSVVTVTADHAHKITLRAAGVTAKAAGFDWEEFPPVRSFDDAAAYLVMSAPILAKLVASVVHATLDDSEASLSQQVFCGVLFRYRSGTLTLVGCDGFRLGVRSVVVAETDDAHDFDLIVHAGKLADVAKQLAKATSVRLLVDSDRRSILLDAESGSWTVATIDGQYPNYERIVPDPGAVTATVTVSRADLMRATDLVRTITYESTTKDGKVDRTVRARIRTTDGGLTVEATDATQDHAVTAELAADMDGKVAEITFQGAYLRDAVRALEGDRVTLELIGPASPALVRESGPRNGHCQVLMPMHIAR
jgi:DNA polymerase-3 subunit beta